jgi:hypothetical protein
MPTELGLPSVAYEMTKRSSPVWQAQGGSVLMQKTHVMSRCDDGDDVNRAPRPNEEEESRHDEYSTRKEERPCACGFCGECIADIDLAQKERWKSRMQAKDMKAREAEKIWEELYGKNGTELPDEGYKLPKALEEYARWYESEKATGAWQLLAAQDEWETEQQLQEEGYVSADGPKRSQGR